MKRSTDINLKSMVFRVILAFSFMAGIASVVTIAVADNPAISHEELKSCGNDNCSTQLPEGASK